MSYYFAEAIINGILRGGLYNTDDKTFKYHPAVNQDRITVYNADKLPGLRVNKTTLPDDWKTLEEVTDGTK